MPVPISSQALRAGKLPPALLADLLAGLDCDDPRVLIGPRPGVDAAVLDFGDRGLVAASDPVTFATDLIGWYLVQVNANDLAVMGATPRWLLATLLFPPGTPPQQVRDVFDQIGDACCELGASLIGGHTELAAGLTRPIAVGAMLGEVDRADVVGTSGGQPGDRIVLSGTIAIEGTALLASEAPTALREAGIGPDPIGRAAGFLRDPGISVVKAAAIARGAVAVHAMHDPTEGGLATGLRELAEASGTGLSVDADRIAILPECRAFCTALHLDPLGLIASGALLIAVAAADVPGLLAAFADAGIPAADIGRLTEQGADLHARVNGVQQTLPHFDRDELARFFES